MLTNHLVMPALVMEEPGANRSTQEPMLEKLDSLSCWSELATAMVWVLDAGDCVHASVLGEASRVGERYP